MVINITPVIIPAKYNAFFLMLLSLKNNAAKMNGITTPLRLIPDKIEISESG